MNGLAEAALASGSASDRATIDANLLEQLYRRHGRALLRRAHAIMGDSAAAEDAVQEALLRAFGACAEFTSALSPLGWLLRITTNICFNKLRDTRRHQDILRRLSPRSEATQGPLPETALIAHGLLDSVPANLQEIAICYFVEQMSQDEISALLEVPRRTIGYRLKQFRSLALAATEERAA